MDEDVDGGGKGMGKGGAVGTWLKVRLDTRVWLCTGGYLAKDLARYMGQ